MSEGDMADVVQLGNGQSSGSSVANRVAKYRVGTSAVVYLSTISVA